LRGDYGKGGYSLLSKNCEHFANLVVHGVNYSEQISKYYITGIYTSPLALIEKGKINDSLEKKVDKLTFNNLKKKRELTNEEQQIFQELEAYILQPTLPYGTPGSSK
jgi:hypothetical protein